MKIKYLLIISILILVIIVGLFFICYLIEEKNSILHKNEDLVKKIHSISLENNEKEIDYLILASKYGDIELIEYFLNKKIDINIKNKAGISMLWSALSNGQMDMVRFLMQNNANALLDNDKPLIFEALFYEDEELANFFIEIGVDVNIKKEDGQTALHEASWRGWIKIAEKLIDKGADINAIIESDFYKGYTPIKFAIEYDHIDMVKLLISKGFDKYYKDIDGKNLLHCASEYGNTEICNYLIESDINVNDVDYIGGTPLFYSEVYGMKESSDLLIKKGAKLFIDGININFKHKTTLIHIASDIGNTNLIEQLIKKGADVNSTNEYGFTPLHFAVINNDINIAELLIKSGADANIFDNEGKTPMRYALLSQFDIILSLIKENDNILQKSTQSRPYQIINLLKHSKNYHFNIFKYAFLYLKKILHY